MGKKNVYFYEYASPKAKKLIKCSWASHIATAVLLVVLLGLLWSGFDEILSMGTDENATIASKIGSVLLGLVFSFLFHSPVWAYW